MGLLIDALIRSQTEQRESLVRTNFGLFVHCAKGLEWLKAYRKGVAAGAGAISPISSPTSAPSRKGATESPPQEQVGGRMTMLKEGETGESKLRHATSSLDSAKAEANQTLAPILDRLKKTREIKNAENVVKRLAAGLEHPHKLRLALTAEDYHTCVLIYARVLAMPVTQDMQILKRVKNDCLKQMIELKELCASQLCLPNNHFGSLVR